jgi:phosphoglycolate phosphatase
MPIRGIIFDFDGTLADTLPDIAAAVNVGLRSFSLPERPASDIRQWVGEGLPTLCGRALAASGCDGPLPQLVEVVTDSYRRHRLERTQPFPGISELLDGLAARGVRMAVLTNKPHEHTVPMVEALFPRWQFTAVEGYRIEDRRKPDPRTAWEIVERMRLPRTDVAIVGDSFTDMHTAVNAGLVPIGATWGYRSRQELLDAGALHLIDVPTDLLQRLPQI